VHIVTPDTFISSAAFSPNNRFLYVGSRDTLLQFDMNSSNVDSSQVVVGAWDSSYYFGVIPIYFFLSQLAPDGKIYISTWNGTPYLHVIDQPDSSGIACNFDQRGFDLTVGNNPVPNFPNYDLGPLIGSPCDTVFIEVHNVQNKVNDTFFFSPNPATDQINVTYSVQQNTLLTITDLLGKEVNRLILYPYFKNRIIYVNDLQEGIYLITLKQSDKVLSSNKLIVQK
jgi:hypothetical protein